MTEQKKLIGEERRSRILQILMDTTTPITGGELAAKTEVSRQAIVRDMNLLKARNEPIIATSQGYIYLKQTGTLPLFEKTIACRHLPHEVESELHLIVDQGVTVKDVQIEHPVYGNLNAALMVSNRKDVKQFMERISRTKASLLSKLTFGLHLHTLSSTSKTALIEVENTLKKAGFLLEADE